MPTLCRLVVLVIALAIALPAGAWAQTTTIPPNGGDLSDDPPVDLRDNGAGDENGDSSGDGSGGGSSDGTGRASGGSSGSSGAPTGTAELPDTGSDPRLLFLAGAALVLIGLGLRLRSADADLY